MNGQVWIVGLEHGDRVLHRVVGQADPAGGLDDGEGVELAGVADEQARLEPGGDEQEHVRAHLVGLVDDGPAPRFCL